MNTFIPSHSKWLLPVSMLVSPLASAIEPPKDNAQPPAVQAAQPDQPEAMPIQAKAFIGLVSGRIPEALSTHLGVRNGEGVLVRSVMPDGPAAKAGIKANDIIVTVGEKIAFSPAELSEIILEHQPGDQVKVGLISEGKGTEINVTLGTRPERFAQRGPRGQRLGPNAAELFQMDGMPEEMAERLRDMIEGNMMELQLNGQPLAPGQGIPNIQRDMDQLREQMQELREQHQDMLKQGDLNLGNINANATIRLMDGDGSIEMSTKNGDKKLTVRDKDNNIEWQGPWNNDEDKAKAPDEIRDRAEKLNFDGGGFKFEFNGR